MLPKRERLGASDLRRLRKMARIGGARTIRTPQYTIVTQPSNKVRRRLGITVVGEKKAHKRNALRRALYDTSRTWGGGALDIAITVRINPRGSSSEKLIRDISAHFN